MTYKFKQYITLSIIGASIIFSSAAYAESHELYTEYSDSSTTELNDPSTEYSDLYTNENSTANKDSICGGLPREEYNNKIRTEKQVCIDSCADNSCKAACITDWKDKYGACNDPNYEPRTGQEVEDLVIME